MIQQHLVNISYLPMQSSDQEISINIGPMITYTKNWQSPSTIDCIGIVTEQKVTEWEITKTEVGNEMEIFITLTKYNTCRWHEEGNNY